MSVLYLKSTGRAVVQTGSYGAVLASLIALPVTTPVIAACAAVGTTVTFGNYLYDKWTWTDDQKMDYLRRCCAADIHHNYEKNYKQKLLKNMEKTDDQYHS